MTSKARWTGWVIGAWLWGCGPQQPPPLTTATPGLSSLVPTEAPSPIALASPPLPPARYGPIQLDRMQAEELAQLMQHLYRRADFPGAAWVGQWAVHAGAEGRYDLACCLALASQPQTALYFLQEAAEKEGVDVGHAQVDPDLATLRGLEQWPPLLAYLQGKSDYWQSQQILRTRLILPKNHRQSQAIGAVIGLHGLGGNEHFIGQEFQALADRTGLAFIGLNGSIPLGPRSFRWSDNLERNRQQVDQALASLHNKVQLASDRLILFGFSQGAGLALDLAASQPRRYCGVLALSPQSPPPLLALPLVGQRYLLSAGAEESPEVQRSLQQSAKICREGGAEVKLKLYPGINYHGFPPDFPSQFPLWLDWLKASSPVEGKPPGIHNKT